MTDHKLRVSSFFLSKFGFLFLACFVLVIVRGKQFSGMMLVNGGYVLVNQQLGKSGVVTDTDGWQEAENYLGKAVRYDVQAPVAWRALGYIYNWQGKRGDAVAAWQKGEHLVDDLIQYGHFATQAGQVAEALVWYEYATAVSPHIGDGWYYLALAYEKNEAWAEAIYAYDQAVQGDSFLEIGLSDVYFRQGLFYQRVAAYQDIMQSDLMYTMALEKDSFSSPFIKAETFYKRGEIYQWQNRSIEVIIPEFQLALELAPNHYWAHLRLGTLYALDGDVSMAEEEINQALGVWPDDASRKWPYRYLGDIYEDVGRLDEAQYAYERALQIDPTDEQIALLLMKVMERPLSQP